MTADLKYSDSDIIEAMLRVWPEAIAMGGIEATRIALGTLLHFGVKGKAVACDVWVGNAAACAGDAAGHYVEHNVGIGTTSPGERYAKSGWDGHLIACGDDWMIDMMIGRLHDPKHGLILPGRLRVAAPMDLVDNSIHKVNLSRGGIVLYRLHPKVVRYRQTTEWASARVGLIPSLDHETRVELERTA